MGTGIHLEIGEFLDKHFSENILLALWQIDGKEKDHREFRPEGLIVWTNDLRNGDKNFFFFAMPCVL